MPITHPPYDAVPRADTLGVRHIEEMLSDLAFPMDSTTLRQRAGDWRVPITGVDFVPLREMLDGVPDQRFSNAHAVTTAISRAHPEMRE